MVDSLNSAANASISFANWFQDCPVGGCGTTVDPQARRGRRQRDLKGLFFPGFDHRLGGFDSERSGHFDGDGARRTTRVLYLQASSPWFCGELSPQQQVIAVVRQLESEGVLSLKGGGGGDEQYVV